MQLSCNLGYSQRWVVGLFKKKQLKNKTQAKPKKLHGTALCRPYSKQVSKNGQLSLRYSLPTRSAWCHSTSYVSSPPAAGHACPVSRAAKTGNGAAVVAWASSHAWWSSTKSGRLLQVRGAMKAFGDVGVLQLPPYSIFFCSELLPFLLCPELLS